MEYKVGGVHAIGCSLLTRDLRLPCTVLQTSSRTLADQIVSNLASITMIGHLENMEENKEVHAHTHTHTHTLHDSAFLRSSVALSV